MSIINYQLSPPPLWVPSPESFRGSRFAEYLEWLAGERGYLFAGYMEAWEWSVTHIEEFWETLWEFFEIESSRPYERVLDERKMPGARWFPGAELNYAGHALRSGDDDSPALYFQSETRPCSSISRELLRRQVASVAEALREMGVGLGDRVVGYMPNIPETVIAFLATASIGAVWSSCSPDFGAQSVVERFAQIEPKVLFAVDGYSYGGRAFDRREVVAGLRETLPSLVATVLVPSLDPGASIEGTLAWEDLLDRDEPLRFEQVAFDHPLWILYSSGTTGAPKAIVHGHGGILLEHLKTLQLQTDVRRNDRLLWYTTTGWMMWNRLVGGLLAGATIVLYDGSPAWPDLNVLWDLAARTGVTHFGGGASYYTACRGAKLQPGRRNDLSSLRMVSSTGSPLPADMYSWIYSNVKEDLWLASSSGGTDVATAFLGACPTLPVHAGELQGPALGVSAHAFDDAGQPVVGEVGELVITEPMPSMPLYFWNDDDGSRYHESYFDTYPGIWRHGDWVRFTGRGSAVIVGRSDSTLNRHGIRIGSSEIYTAVEAVPGVADSLVIGLELPDGGYYMPLFVVLDPGLELDASLVETIRSRIRSTFSARHLPDEIIRIDEVPRTLNGKKLEVPIRKILLGFDPERVVNRGALANPDSLRFFIDLASSRRDA